MIAIKGRTQSWGCFRSRYAWRWQLIENANTQADEWEECWVYTAWKDYLPHFRRLEEGGGGCALYSFREEIKPIGYEAQPCRWEERAVCRDSVILQTRGTDTKRRWLDNDRVVEKKIALWVNICNLWKKEAHMLYLYEHQHKPPNLPVYQSDAAFLWSVTLMAAAKLLPLSLCKVLRYLKSSRQIKIDRQTQADRQMDAQAEPLCAVVLTTEQEQRPGLWMWMENETLGGVNKKKKKKEAQCKPH